MSLKETLKKIPLIHRCGAEAKEFVRDVRAICAMKQERRISRQTPIRVGFLCQFLPAWPKVEPIYQFMKADPRFEPYLLCVPSDVERGKRVSSRWEENDTYDYFCNYGYKEAINVQTGPDQWLDLKELGIAYVFYPRPYNPRMPRCYQTDVVARYCQICMIMYGISTTEEITRITLNRNFMRYVSLYFAETTFAREVNAKKCALGHKLGLQQSVCLGYPSFEKLEKMQGTESPAWEFSENTFRVMWTPRWTTDKAEGGSNFFTYNEAFLAYAEAHPEVDFLFRPHPLMFENFLKTGEMTQQQVDAFKKRCEELKNVRLDTEKEYEATFWGSSVMVSDISGMIPEYFNTGKPVIFCATNMELKLAQFCEELIGRGCYVANDSQELFAYLEQLQRGDDPLRADRKKLIPELFGAAGSGASVRIAEAIAEDAKKRG